MQCPSFCKICLLKRFFVQRNNDVLRNRLVIVLNYLYMYTHLEFCRSLLCLYSRRAFLQIRAYHIRRNIYRVQSTCNYLYHSLSIIDVLAVNRRFDYIIRPPLPIDDNSKSETAELSFQNFRSLTNGSKTQQSDDVRLL